MSYDFYKIFHLSFVFISLLSLGGVWAFYGLNQSKKSKIKSFLLGMHGLSLFLVFVAGFGLIAKLRIANPWPLWIYIKIFLWIFIASMPFILRKSIRGSRKELKSIVLYFLVFGVFFLALLTARLKFS